MAGTAQSTTLTRFGGWVQRHARWVVIFWVAAAGLLNVAVPQLEQVVSGHSADFPPRDLPANQNLERMADEFGVPRSNAVSSVVLANENGFSAADEKYLATLTGRLLDDPENVSYLIDMYGNPVTRDIAISEDGKAVTLLIASAGSVGSTRAHHATQAIRAQIDAIPRPDGLVVHYSGPTAMLSDLFEQIDVSLLIITAVSILLITVLLFAAYRVLATAMIPLITIGVTLAVVRPVIALLGQSGTLSISNFTIAIMTALVLGAGTDYAIFTIAGYHEGRRAGRSVADSVARSSGRTGPILVASALTIAAACGSMVFTKIGMFTTAGPPTAIAVLITLFISLTLPLALLSLAGARGWAEPRASTERRWRRRGAQVIRHAGIYTAAALVFLLGTAAITTTFRMNWDESAMPRGATDATRGYDVVTAHFGRNEIAPEFVVVRSDHDLRNTADLAALEVASIAVANMPEVAAVYGLTRPDGSPLAEAATGYQTGIVGDELAGAHRRMVEATPELQRLASGVAQLSAGADEAVRRMPEMVSGTEQLAAMAGGILDRLDRLDAAARTATGGRGLADGIPALRRTLGELLDSAETLSQQTRALTAVQQADRLFAPWRSATPSAACRADASCLAAREAWSALNRATGGRAGAVFDDIGALTANLENGRRALAAGIPAVRQALPLLDLLTDGSTDRLRDGLTRLKSGVDELSGGLNDLSDGLHQAQAGTDQTVAMTAQLTAGLHRAADYLQTMSASTRSGPGAGFYLPPEALNDPRFVEGGRLLITPDGKTARMMVMWGVNPYSQEAMRASRELPGVVERALAPTTLADATASNTGLASLSADMQDQVRRDLLLFGTVAALAVLLILMVLLRSLLAPILLVATVLLSFASAVGVSVLVWQHIIGIDLDWSVIPVSFMAVIAVGADYSMLFASRIREEAEHNGMVRGILRAFGSTGGVITTAGIVFALTMFALMSGTVLNLVPIGFTIGVGLLLDIVIVRTVLVPAMMAVLGDRMWWPAKPRH